MSFACSVDSVCSGLLGIRVSDREEWESTKFPVPLISVEVKASVVHAVGQVEVTQVYVNKEDVPIEAVYYFPVNPEGAVTLFEAELEGKIIKGTVKSKEEATQAYEKAVEKQKTAFLGEETKADILKLQVGHLKPGSQAKVRIGYVTEVKNEPGCNSIRFYIPTSIAPRYVSSSEYNGSGRDIASIPSKPPSAPLRIKVAVSLQDGIKSIQSPSHSVKVTRSDDLMNGVWSKSIVELSTETTEMDRDFVLSIVPEEIHKPRLYSEKLADDGSTAMMLHLVPSFKLDEQKTELIFVLDRSGSMEGQSITMAKKALLMFLHSMSPDCYFNVIGFGSSFTSLFPSSVKYDDKSLLTATSHANHLEADMGGTEILEPLQHIYGTPGVEGYLRQIFILTDGQVSNTEAVLGITHVNAHKARVFALGIGHAACHDLVEGVAKAGGGTAAFVTDNESVDRKVLNQLKNALQPSLTDVQLEWEEESGEPYFSKKSEVSVVVNKEKTLLGYNKPLVADSSSEREETWSQSPKRIPPIYDGSQMLVFGLFKGEPPKSVTVKAMSPDGPLTLKVEHSFQNDVGSSSMLHHLAAVKLVRELELEICAAPYDKKINEVETLKMEIIKLACNTGITSKYTSFVAVETDTGDATCSRRDRDRSIDFKRRRQYRRTFCKSVSPKSYEYKKNSSLVLQADMHLIKRKTGYASKDEVDASSIRRRSRSRSRSRSNSNSSTSSDSYSECDSASKSKSSSKLKSNDSELELSSSSPLLRIVRLQKFDGCFPLSKKLAQLLGKTLETLQQAATEYKVSNNVLATLFAVVYLQKMEKEKELWELVVKKAKQWILNQLGNSEDKEEILQNLIKSISASF